jgi:hypothetical protein
MGYAAPTELIGPPPPEEPLEPLPDRESLALARRAGGARSRRACGRLVSGRPFPPGVSGNPGGRPKGLVLVVWFVFRLLQRLGRHPARQDRAREWAAMDEVNRDERGIVLEPVSTCCPGSYFAQTHPVTGLRVCRRTAVQARWDIRRRERRRERFAQPISAVSPARMQTRLGLD